MSYIDLHVHSNVSDGTCTPTELVKLAYESNLSAFALTDHDTFFGVDEAVNSSKAYGIEVIPGIELSAFYMDREIHILGLFVDYKNKNFIGHINVFQEIRELRNNQMVQKLTEHGVNISMMKLREIEGNAILTRAHFAKYLTTNGYTKNNDEAFEKYLSRGASCYVPKELITPEKAIGLILDAKGIPVLAHPLLYKLSKEQLDSLVYYLKNIGLKGIEAIYSINRDSDERDMKRLAKKYDLLISGGSDFHGENKPYLKLGVGKGNLRVPYSVLEKLKGSLVD